ncbi:MAG: hypothetical protein R3D57_14155 [Hyphomicrobiaceae bacterium]
MSSGSMHIGRFWGDFSPAVAQSLTAEQRTEIERVLDLSATPQPSRIGDVRLSFYWFFVRILWGREKRSADRLKQERALYPAMTKRNAPAILTLGVAYTAFWYMVMGICGFLLAGLLVY